MRLLKFCNGIFSIVKDAQLANKNKQTVKKPILTEGFFREKDKDFLTRDSVFI